MIKIRLSHLESIKDFFVGLGALLVLGFFGIMPVLIVLAFFFPSLESLAEYVAMGGVLVALSAVLVVALFYLCLPMFLLSYVPCKIVQGIFSIFVEFVSDEEYERYKEDKT